MSCSVRGVAQRRGTHLACAFVNDISGHSDGRSLVHDAHFGDHPRESHSSAHYNEYMNVSSWVENRV